MSDSAVPSTARRIYGWLLIGVGLSVFLIRFQHAGPYALPRGGNGLGGFLALLLGAWMVRDWIASSRLASPLFWVALASSPIVLFFALYATMAELEEVVVLKANDSKGQPAALRLWIVDQADGAWVTMPRQKADEHGLRDAKVVLLRQGRDQCVITRRHEDRATVNRAHKLRHQKYSVQRLATRIGLFGSEAGEKVVALRLEACAPDSAGG